MDKDIKIAKIGAIGVIIAAVIGGLFAVCPAVFENNKLKNEYEKLETENSELIVRNQSLQESNENIQNKYDELNSNYSLIKSEYEVLEKDYNNLLSDKEESDENEAILAADQDEINDVLESMDRYRNGDNKSYYEYLLTDADELELFYKMYISIQYYKYSNIIKAFEEYGIDCEGLSINENTLAVWDIQNLYIYCQIKERVEDSQDKKYLFKDYKMNTIDTCDYKEYGFAYQQDLTYESIEKQIDGCIDKITKKLKRNSLPIT